jgi:acetaldehyde dehydrogenase (acetylating)
MSQTVRDKVRCWPAPQAPVRTPQEQVAVLLRMPDKPKVDLLAKRRAAMAAAMRRDTATRWPFWCLPDPK